MTNVPTEIDEKLLEFLVCPITKTTLIYDRESGKLISKAANLSFTILNGIPIMLVDDALPHDITMKSHLESL